jgi:radical SAM domain protein|nr:MAG TPA: putative Fe-S oxidoreductase [Caudoviricetes sp.]
MNISNIECNIIDWRITAKCNSSCDYCYASAQLPEMSVDGINKIIDSIIKSGCKAVCISGGEPLLNKNAISIIRQLHNSGISVYLSTNGTEYMKYRDELEKYISKLSLPLDGFDEENNKINGRKVFYSDVDGKASEFQSVIDILDYYENHPHNFAIKIGTVLTARNADIEYFRKMYELLKKYTIDLWKIYEFIPEGKGKSNQAELKLSSAELKLFLKDFKQFQENILNEGNLECLIATRSMRDSAYFIIQPDGTVVVPVDNGDIGVNELVVGDLNTQDIVSVLVEWNKQVSSIRHNANYETRCITRSLAKTHIDKIDKKIIYFLDQNPLQEYAELATKLTDEHISCDELEKRIEKLYSIRAIRHIMPIINVSQFGLEVFLLNLYFKPNSALDSAQIAEILCHDPYIAWVAECYEYNTEDNYVIFRISILIENNAKLYERIKYLRSIFGEMLYRYEIDIVPDKYICGQNFLIDKMDNSTLSHDHIMLDSVKTRITPKEYAVIVAMNSSERLTIDTIAKAASLRKEVVLKIIDELLSRAVINKFQIVLDTNVLGYQCYMFFVKFNSCSSKELFEEYIKTLPNVTHINTLNTGRWDIDVEIHVDRPEVCAAIWSDLENRFSDDILDKKLIRIKKDHKFKFLIDSTLKNIESSVDTRWWKR